MSEVLKGRLEDGRTFTLTIEPLPVIEPPRIRIRYRPPAEPEAPVVAEPPPAPTKPGRGRPVVLTPEQRKSGNAERARAVYQKNKALIELAKQVQAKADATGQRRGYRQQPKASPAIIINARTGERRPA